MRSYFFHYEVADGLTFLCLTDEAFGRQMPFVFLDDIKKRFLSEWGSKWRTSIAFSAQTEFGRTLKQLAVRFSFSERNRLPLALVLTIFAFSQQEYYSNDINADRIKKVQGAIGEVHNLMLDNIEKVLARGERIEDTVKRTDEMANNALHFKKAGVSLKRTMWFKNIKLWIIIGVLVVLLSYIIAAIACKSPIFKGCWKKTTNTPSASAANTAAPTILLLLASFVASIALGL